MSLESRKKLSESHKGKKHSKETKEKMSISALKNPRRYWLGKHTVSGEKSGTWKGDKVGYWGIHKWLYKYYGKANYCENLKCSKKSKIFHWALIKNKNYERKRDNFMQLCMSCHWKYDEIIKNIKN